MPPKPKTRTRDDALYSLTSAFSTITSATTEADIQAMTADQLRAITMFQDSTVGQKAGYDAYGQPIHSFYNYTVEDDTIYRARLSDNAFKDGAFCIGDVWLSAPPQSITVSEYNSNQEIPTFRSPGNPVKKGDSHEVRVDLQLLFPNIDTINSELRPMIAQFVTSPVIYIENYFLRKALSPNIPGVTATKNWEAKVPEGVKVGGVDEMKTQLLTWQKEQAINASLFRTGQYDKLLARVPADSDIRKQAEDLIAFNKKASRVGFTRWGWSPDVEPMLFCFDSYQLQTVPGFPGALTCSITLTLFNHRPYAKQVRWLRKWEDVEKQAKYFTEKRRYFLESRAPDSDLEDCSTAFNSVQTTSMPSESLPYKQYYSWLLPERDIVSAGVSSSNYMPLMDAIPYTLQEVGHETDQDGLTLSWCTAEKTTLEIIKSRTDALKKTVGVLQDTYERWAAVANHDIPTNVWAYIHTALNSKQYFTTTMSQFLRNHLASGLLTIAVKDDKLRSALKPVIGDIKNLDEYLASIKRNSWREFTGGTDSALLMGDLLAYMHDSVTVGDVGKVVPLTKALESPELFVTDPSPEFKGTMLAAFTLMLRIADEQQGLISVGRPYINIMDPEYHASISGISFACRNNFVRVPILSELIPTYQHTGRQNISVTINIQTGSLDLLSQLKRMSVESTVLQQVRDVRLSASLLKFLPENVISVSGNKLLAMLGIRNVLVGNVHTATISGSPGLYSITLDLIQADYTLYDLERLESYHVVPEAALVHIADCFLNGMKTEHLRRCMEPFMASDPAFYFNLVDILQLVERYNLALGFIKQESQEFVDAWHAQYYDLLYQGFIHGAIGGAVIGAKVGGGVGAFAGALIGATFTISAISSATLYTKGEAVTKTLAPAMAQQAATIAIVIQSLKSILRVMLADSASREAFAERLKNFDFVIWDPNTKSKQGNKAEEISASGDVVLKKLSTIKDVIDHYSPEINFNLARLQSSRKDTCLPDIIQVNLGLVGSRRLYAPGDLYYYREAYLDNEIIEATKGIIENEHELTLAAHWDIYTITKPEVDGMIISYKNWLETEGATLTNSDKEVALKVIKNLEATAKGLDDYGKYIINKVNPVRGQINVNSTLLAHRLNQRQESAKHLARLFDAHRRILELGARIKNKQTTPAEKKEFEKQIELLRYQVTKYVVPTDITVASLSGVTPDEANNVLDPIFGGFHPDSAKVEAGLLARALRTSTYEQDLSFSRVYPTIKMYLIEKDAPQWKLFDDFYGYRAILSVDILKDAYAASETAVIRLSNTTNVLSDTTAINAGESVGVDGTTGEQTALSINLQPGADIAIKYGYEADPNLMPFKFRGTIVEVNPGPILEIVAQSAGAQLMQVPFPTESKSFGFSTTQRETGNVATYILDSMEGMRGFGRWGTDQILNAEGSDLRPSSKEWFLSLVQQGIKSPQPWGAYTDLDENVYLPYSFSAMGWLPGPGCATRTTFDWICNKGKSCWELLHEIALYNRNYIVRPLIFNADINPKNLDRDLRYTLYLGPREGVYKCSDVLDPGGEVIYNNYVTDIAARWPIVKENIVKLAQILQNAKQLNVGGSGPTQQANANGREGWYIHFTPELAPGIVTDEISMDAISHFDPTLAQLLTSKDYWLELKNVYNFNAREDDAGTDPRTQKHDTDWVHPFMQNMIGVSLDANRTPRINMELMTKHYDTTVASIAGRLALKERMANYTLPPEQNDYVARYTFGTFGVKNKIVPTATYAPVVKQHFIDSYHHIIANNLVASSKGISNRVRLVYPNREPAEEEKIVSGAIKRINIVTKFWSTMGAWIGLSKGNTDVCEAVVCTDDDINPDEIKEQVVVYSNIDSDFFDEPWALYVSQLGNYSDDGQYNQEFKDQLNVYGGHIKGHFVAAQMLRRLMEPMYDGSIVIMGNPNIEPFDEVYMSDFANDMFGPIVVGRVHDHIDATTGFTTTITPRLYCKMADLTNSMNPSYFQSIAQLAGLKGLGESLSVLGMGWALTSVAGKANSYVGGLASESGKSLTAMLKEGAGDIMDDAAMQIAQKGAKAGASQKVALSALGGGAKLGQSVRNLNIGGLLNKIVCGYALYKGGSEFISLSNMMIGTMVGRQALDMVPVWYRGKPLVAGVTGQVKNDIFAHMTATANNVIARGIDTLAGGSPD